MLSYLFICLNKFNAVKNIKFKDREMKIENNLRQNNKKKY